MKKKAISADRSRGWSERDRDLADQLMYTGFAYLTISGVSMMEPSGLAIRPRIPAS